MNIKEIKAIKPPHPFEAYTQVISPLTSEEGGGFLISFPDLPGCMSDGETIEEAIHNGRDAFLAWISAQADMGREIPMPSYRVPETEPSMSGKFVQRVPKSLHAKLTVLAKQEGVSLNTLVLTFIAKGVGMRKEKRHPQKLTA
ncbi:MAG: type II toxin-antitoxin system HicB family antitoxin [Syntrophales bacterium]|nr:type II toxin-antitoxin system HicB family antitoxin [Syntrophales bacterium]